MASREDSHQKSNLAAWAAPMAAAATTVQVIATWLRPHGLQWHLGSHHQTLGQG